MRVMEAMQGLRCFFSSVWGVGGGRGRSLHEAEGEDAHEEFALAALGVQVAEDGDGEEDGDEVGGDVDAAEGDPDGAEVDALAGCVGEELLPEVGDGLADEGEGQDVGEGADGVEAEEVRADGVEARESEDASVEEEDGGFEEETFDGVDDGGGPLCLLVDQGVGAG